MCIAGALTLAPSLAQAALRDVADWARLHGCHSGSVRASLRETPALDEAAARLANGQSLRAALASVGYLASQSSAVHVSGTTTDAEVGRLLVAKDCATLTDAAITEIGVQRQGREVWLVFAAPVMLPLPADAARISERILDVVNAARGAGHRCGATFYGAAPPLALDSRLTAAALSHSQEMARYEEFDHRGHDGSSPAQRVARAGYGATSRVGENIAAGAMTPLDVATGWLASPPHCENIMDAKFGQIGIAFAVNRGSAELVYWTQDFAARRPPDAASR